MQQVTKTLSRLFERRRIVFWYDETEELRTQFQSVDMPDVVKVEVQNNEFSLKYRMLRQEADRKFLVYRPGARPADKDNWLLDVELAHEEFRASQVGLWLSALGLKYDFADLVQEHANFFKKAKRVELLAPHVDGSPVPSQIRMGMLRECGEQPRAD